MKLNEITASPPVFTEALTMRAETKTFKKHENYEYTIEYKKFKVPNYDKMKSSGNKDSNSSANQIIQKQIFKTIKENMEKLLWQARVEVHNKETNMTYELSTWFYNHKAKVIISGF